MRRLVRHSTLSLCFLLLAAAGCSQDEGERCQQNSDCASGLECQGVTQGGGYVDNGICKPIGSVATKKDAGSSDTRKPDTAPKLDTLMTDALPGVDLGIFDETRRDTNAMDTTPSPTVDALRTDTQARADAGVDATVRTDAAIDAPVADAPSDLPTLGDGALD